MGPAPGVAVPGVRPPRSPATDHTMLPTGLVKAQKWGPVGPLVVVCPYLNSASFSTRIKERPSDGSRSAK